MILLRHSILGLLACLLLAVPAGAQEAEPPLDGSPVASEGSTEGETAQEQPSAPPELPLATIPLRENLRFTVRPTILGLIPPDSAENYGEGLIRISGVSGRRIELHYEIKEEIEKERGGAETFELKEAPMEMRTEFLTRIRRGDAVIADINSGQRIANPLFWGDGEISADDYGLLWLAPGWLSVLKDSGSIEWDPQCAADPQSDTGKRLAEVIEARRKAAGSEGQTRLELTVERGSYIVPVNGEMSRLQAIVARDSLGMAEYWFLDDPDNPLLLKMSFIAEPDASPSSDGLLRQLQAGIGFAITSINY